MCVGLPARVMKIQNGMALVDASGAKREVSAALIDELIQAITSWSTPAWPLPRLLTTMPMKPTTFWRTWIDGRREEADGPGYH